jgi:hypothetical protein
MVVSPFLRIVTLVAATAFAAIAVYISVVEQPARLLLETQPALAQWAAGYPTAMKIQGGLAIVCAMLAGWLWFRTRNLLWLAGAAIVLANWPFTLVFLMPINDVMLTTAPGESQDGMRLLLSKWGQLHAVRSLLGALAVVVLAFAMARDLNAMAANAQPK